MSVFWASIFLTALGNLAAYQRNLEDNRLHAIESAHSHSSDHNRRSFLETNRIYKENDYYDSGSGGTGKGASPQLRYPAPYSDTKAKNKVYQPREDPRLFYQSDDYLKEVNGQNVNLEVASIYPGREVVRFDAANMWSAPTVRQLRSRQDNSIDYAEYHECIQCPQDRTLIAKPGFDRVLLQSPRLLLCSGRKAPKGIHLVKLHGPRFGKLLREGTYTILGRIMNWNENLQMCKFKVHVVIQSCRTPKSLEAYCKGLQDRVCTFSCRDNKLELHGPSSLTCGADLQWNGKLPTCRVRHWCYQPSPPEHGRISCIGNSTGDESEGLAEGSRCRVRCALGYRSNPRLVSFCHRGNWTRTFTCRPRKLL